MHGVVEICLTEEKFTEQQLLAPIAEGHWYTGGFCKILSRAILLPRALCRVKSIGADAVNVCLWSSMECQNGSSMIGAQSPPGRLETLEECASRLGGLVFSHIHHPQRTRELLQEAIYGRPLCQYILVYKGAREYGPYRLTSPQIYQSAFKCFPL